MSLYHVSSCQTAEDEDDETLPLKRFSRLKRVVPYKKIGFYKLQSRHLGKLVPLLKSVA